ncbi:hypothetical protein C8R46DRAFT_4425, partial [Mycena filopes]
NILSHHAPPLHSTLGFLWSGQTYASYHDFGIPASSATVDVRAFNVVNVSFVNLPSASLIAPILPGRGDIPFPNYAFLVEHKKSRKRLMFDLGIRSDPRKLCSQCRE